jgi:hypothetical protein
MAGLFSTPEPRGGDSCERSRLLASLRLDGELSELENARLAKHLETCAECSKLDLGLVWMVDLMRSAEAEVPSRRFAGPRTRVSIALTRRVAVAAAVLAAALGSIVGLTLDRPASGPEEPAPQVSLLTGDRDELRQLPRPPSERPPQRQPGGLPEGIV